MIHFGPFNNEDNLVLKTYQYAFLKRHLTPLPIKITQRKNDIPLERGLGSSSSCIIAGLLMANTLLHHTYSQDELYQLAIEIEGHPDNVAPCLYGGLIANYKDEEKFIPTRLPLSKELSFVVVSPETKVKTEEARKILPKNYSREDVVVTLSHLASLPTAFLKGDLKALKRLLEDRIHVPYRSRLIPSYDVFEEIANRLDLPFTISGSGSTMLFVISSKKQDELIHELEKITSLNFSYKLVSVDELGARVERI